jgi:hypothetical protein
METYGIIGIVHLVLFLIALFSILAGKGSLGHKFLWTMIVLLFPCVGLILYYVMGRNAADA